MIMLVMASSVYQNELNNCNNNLENATLSAEVPNV